MRSLIITTIVLTATVAGSVLILEEGFEEGFDSGAWTHSENSSGPLTLDTVIYRSGASALRLDDSIGNYIVARDLGASMRGHTVEVWFYDDMSPNLETHVAVSQATDYLSSTRGYLLVGVESFYEPNHYIAVEGWHSENGWVNGPQRSLGWHKVTITNVDGQNQCLVDDQLIRVSSYQPDWRYLMLLENNKTSGGVSRFDDLVVETQLPVSDKVHSWSHMKNQF